MDNLLHDLPDRLPEELFETLARGRELRIERIVSRGHATPEGQWYDQPDAEWVMVVQGAARVVFEDGRQLDMGPGDWIDIPAHCRHRVAWTVPDQATVWLAVHYL